VQNVKELRKDEHLTGAMYSTIAVGGPASGLLFFLLGYIFIAGSYVLYHKRLGTDPLSNAKEFNQNLGGI
jgi:hypothetical protein